MTTSVELPAATTSYQLSLPHSNTEYTIKLRARSEEDHPEAARAVKTLPYVHCESTGAFSIVRCDVSGGYIWEQLNYELFSFHPVANSNTLFVPKYGHLFVPI